MSRVLVTGGASGLGAALAAAFVARGDEVLRTDLNADRRTLTPRPRRPLRRRLGRGARVGRASTGAASTCWSTTPASPAAAGIDVATHGRVAAGSPRSTCSAWSAGPRTFVPMFKQQRVRPRSSTSPRSPAWCTRPGMGSYNAVKAGGGRVQRDLRPRARGVRRALLGGVPVVLPDQPDRDRCRAATRRVGKVIAQPGRRAPPVTADDIAAAVLEGLDRGEELILPDDAARDGVRAEAERPGGVRPGDAQAGRAAQQRCDPTGR